jgi:large subunit ribosomal protein L25
MKPFKLQIENRRGTGRGTARSLRRSGRIPACIYGRNGARSISISSVEFRDLRREIGGGASLLELEDEKGGSILTFVRELQQHAIKDTVQHIDFQEVERGHAFTTEVPVHLSGEHDCPGVRNNGGLIDHQLHTVEVRCRPSKLPEFIEVDASGLDIGDAVHIGDLVAVDGVEFLGDVDLVVVACSAPTVAAAKAGEEEEAVGAGEVPADKVKSDEEAESEAKSEEAAGSEK